MIGNDEEIPVQKYIQTHPAHSHTYTKNKDKEEYRQELTAVCERHAQ